MPAGADNFDREIDPQQQIRQFFTTVRRAWLTIITSLGLGLLIGIAAFLYVPRQWTSTAKLQLKANWMFDSSEQGELEVVPLSTRRAQLEEQLRSAEWVRAALDKLEWPEWSRARHNEESAARFVDRVKKNLRTNITPRGELGERLVFITFTWSDRDRAAHFCEAIVEVWVENATTNYLDDLDHRVSDATRLLAQKRDLLAKRREDIERFEIRNGISAIDQHQGSQARADELHLTLDQLSPEITALQAQIDEFDRTLQARGPDGKLLLPATLDGTLFSEEKASQLARIAAAYVELEGLLAQHWTEKLPRVRILKSELEELIVSVSKAPEKIDAPPPTGAPNPKYEEVQKLRRDVNSQLQALIAKRTNAEGELSEMNDLLRTLPQVLREYSALSMDVAIQEQAVKDQAQASQPFFDRQTLANAKGRKGIVPYHHIERPVAAAAPTASVGWLALAICTMLGLTTAVAIVIGRELLRTSFAHAEQARQALRLPVLGEVAPIQTSFEVRRTRLQRTLQVAASLVVLVGLAAMIIVCAAYPEHLPAGIVRWALDLRDLLL